MSDLEKALSAMRQAWQLIDHGAEIRAKSLLGKAIDAIDPPRCGVCSNPLGVHLRHSDPCPAAYSVTEDEDDGTMRESSYC